jgi:hypothetical protein
LQNQDCALTRGTRNARFSLDEADHTAAISRVDRSLLALSNWLCQILSLSKAASVEVGARGPSGPRTGAASEWSNGLEPSEHCSAIRSVCTRRGRSVDTRFARSHCEVWSG